MHEQSSAVEMRLFLQYTSYCFGIEETIGHVHSQDTVQSV